MDGRGIQSMYSLLYERGNVAIVAYQAVGEIKC